MQKTVVKCLQLIEALGRSEGPQGISELSRELHLGKSNIHRLVDTLTQLGYVRRLAELGKYEPTLKLWEVGIQVLQRLDVRGAAREAMQGLFEKTGETVHLSVLDDGEVVYVDKIESDHPVRAYSRLGSRAPAYCVATGKALLSCLSPEQVLAACPNLVTRTPSTLTTHKALFEELAAVRRQGFAINRGEWWASVCGAAAPIYDATGTAIAAIGISGPTERLKPRLLRNYGAKEVVAAAAQASTALGARRAPSLISNAKPAPNQHKGSGRKA